MNGYGDSDQELMKMALDPDQLPQIPPQSLQDKNDHEKFLKKVSQYFQNKENKSNLDKLIDMAQKGKLPNFSSSQDDLLEAGLDLDGINYVENLKRQNQYPPSMGNIPNINKYTRRTSSNNRKYPNQGIANLDPSMFGPDPTKFMKVDPTQNPFGNERMPAPMQQNNPDVSSMFMQMPPETTFTPQMSMTTNTGPEGTDFFPPQGQFDRMQSFNFDNPNKDLQQQQQQGPSDQNQFYNPSMPAFDYSILGIEGVFLTFNRSKSWIWNAK